MMKAVFPILLVLLICFSAMAQAPAVDSAPAGANSLEEVRDMRRALLVVFKSRVIDVADHDRAIIEDALKADLTPTRRGWVYSQIARKLNKYIKKHKSLSAAKELADAEYVIFFNFVQWRRILYSFYPYGELFVIVKGSSENLKPPRIVWRAKKIQSAEDAIDELIKDLKALRGES
jgi:hypothetical protein